MKKYDIAARDLFIYYSQFGTRDPIRTAPVHPDEAIQQIVEAGLLQGEGGRIMRAFPLASVDILDYLATEGGTQPFTEPTTAKEAFDLIVGRHLSPGSVKRWALQFGFSAKDVIDPMATQPKTPTRKSPGHDKKKKKKTPPPPRRRPRENGDSPSPPSSPPAPRIGLQRRKRG